LSPDNVQLLLERRGMDREAAHLIAPLAGGNMVTACELDNDRLTSRRHAVLSRLATVDASRITTLFDASEELGGSRDEALESLDILVACYRDALLLAAGGTDIVHEGIREGIEAIASRFPLPTLLQVVEDILETRRAVQRNANAKLALDRLFLKISAHIPCGSLSQGGTWCHA
jgi:DNA polymerase-3 subunit delta'